MIEEWYRNQENIVGKSPECPALAATPSVEVMKFQNYLEAEKSLSILADGQLVDIGMEAAPAAAPTDEPVFLQRLRVEQQELDARQQKLGAFIESSEFRLLSETDAALLSKQEALQHVLLQTLNQRIHSASEKHMREKRNA